jgi:adenosylmethionine-8-amino-7-oxononanoate aminotransferase
MSMATAFETDVRHLWHHSLQHSGLLHDPPLLIDRAEGCFVWDSDGNRYLDAMAGLWCVNVGYGRKAIADAVYAQMQKLPYSPLTQSHGPAAELATRVTGLLPDGLEHVSFTNSGSEAVETALKLARQCARQLHPGQSRYKIIARHRAYHGFTMGAASATGQALRKRAFEPLVPGFLHVAPPDRLRCSFCAGADACTLACADEFERVIRMEGPESVAAVIVEPVIGGGGVFPAPDGYLKRLREICDRHEVLLILDEVITGFGRTGTLFAFEQAGIQPDLLVLAKGITSGYLPLGATVASERVFEAFLNDKNRAAKFTQVSTFGGHPCSCAAALANIDILCGERLWENSAAVGSALLSRLREIDDPRIAEVRGRGLLIGIELVSGPEKAPLPETEVIQIQKRIRANGVLVGRNADTVPGFGNVLTISPPLIITESQAEEIVRAVREALAAHAQTTVV